MTAAAVILAAGASVRLGRPKQLLELDGEVLLQRVSRICLEAGCDPVMVVLGSEAEALRPVLDGLAVRVVENGHWPEGMASSIRAGIAALPADTGGVLLLPCDQPALGVELLQEFLRHHEGSPETTLASCYRGGCGIPALFPRGRFDELLQLRGDRGAKALLGDAVRIPFPDGEIDFDTQEEVDAWLRR
jgi:CTP:molybdopterin cytidylyltransferase MocA